MRYDSAEQSCEQRSQAMLLLTVSSPFSSKSSEHRQTECQHRRQATSVVVSEGKGGGGDGIVMAHRAEMYSQQYIFSIVSTIRHMQANPWWKTT